VSEDPISEDAAESLALIELMDAESAPEIPAELPVLGVREQIVFPGGVTPVVALGVRAARLVEEVMDSPDRLLAVVAAREQEGETAGEQELEPEDLYAMGTAAVVQRMLRAPDGSIRLLVQGLERVRIGAFSQIEPYPVAAVEVAPEEVEEGKELEALSRNLSALFGRVVQLVPHLPDELQAALSGVRDATTLSYLVASSMRLDLADRQALLEEPDVAERLRRLTVLVNREIEVLELGQKIQRDVQADMDSAQREHFLRQQMKAIQAELGEAGSVEAEVADLRARLELADPPQEVRAAAERELTRLERVPEASPEHSVIRTYLEWIVDLPWNTLTEDHLDLDAATTVLDEDHYGLDKVKDRILEHLAVVKLNPEAQGPILCFVGPPGVGKTSLGASIARSLGRKFARISVGGVRDESEIRGHRRTYIGAMPGTIVRALRDVGSMNPVLMIDEIDKMGADVRGDPAAAMLEVLDPAQNDTFRDHYLDLPIDLSRVMFICTANVLETIPGPLRDRMETIGLAGYTDEEKLHIAREHLLDRQLERSGIDPATVEIGDDALRTVISEYTREAGVRQLERRLGAIGRKVARRVAEGERGVVTIDSAGVREMLGPERIHSEVKRRTGEPGVVTGLAVTGAGGEILFVEAQIMPGTGKLTVTGQLGDVMRESAQAALSYVRSHAAALGLDIPEDHFAHHDIHIHVPAGAVPKDGPSAGVTMTTALVSALSGREASADVAMTGEITLTGQVLPIGGVKEKVLAARRAGISTVVLPTLNEDQLADVPEDLRDEIEVVLADRLEQVLEVALPIEDAPLDPS
jgi:ATP-dependent Lon protease